MDANAAPVGPERRRSGPCPFCGNWEVAFASDCRTPAGAHLCDLWRCAACGKFYPLDVDEEALPGAARPAVERRGGDDRREHSRFRVQFVLEVLFDGAQDRSPRVATVLDASYGGVCFLYPAPIEPGTQGRLRLSLPSGFAPFVVGARVVRSTPTPGGSNVIAVEFVDVDPKYRVMLERYIRTARE